MISWKLSKYIKPALKALGESIVSKFFDKSGSNTVEFFDRSTRLHKINKEYLKIIRKFQIS